MGVDTGSAVDVIKCVRPGAAKTASFEGGVVEAHNFRKVLFFQDVGVVAGVTPTLDGKIQEAPTLDVDAAMQEALAATDDWVPLRHGAADNIELAAAFTVGAAAVAFYKVKVYLKRLGTIVAGKKIWASIQGDAAGDPDGTDVQVSNVIEAQDIGTDAEYVTFLFPSPVNLTAATAYHVVIAGDYVVSPANQILLGVETVVGTGNLEIFDAAWADSVNQMVEIQGYSLTFSDISGATFTQVDDTSGGVETPETIEVKTSTYGPYLRYVGTIAGGGGESFTMAVSAIGGEKKVLP